MNIRKPLLIAGIAILGFSTMPLNGMQAPSLENQIKSLIGDIKRGKDAIALQKIRSNKALSWAQEPRVGNTALITAASHNRVNVVHALLEAGAQPNQTNKYGDAALHAAARKGYFDVLVFLLAYDGDPNKANEKGETPLSIALDRGHETLVRVMLGEDVPEEEPVIVSPAKKAPTRTTVTLVDDLTMPERKEFYNAVNAIKDGQTGTVREILARYPNLAHVEDKYGNTLLSFAARLGNISLVDLFLKAGADVNRPDNKMSTPLHYAITRRHKEVVRLLQNNGGRVYAKVVLTIQPDYAYSQSDLETSFGRSKYNYIPVKLRPKLELLGAETYHITLAYLSLPMAYSETEGAPYQSKVKYYAHVLQAIASNIKLYERIYEAAFSDPFKWDKVTWLGKFLVVSYEPPKGYQDIIETFYNEVKKEFPDAVKTYRTIQNPHISVMKLKRGEDVSGIRLNQPIVSGTVQPRMFEDSRIGGELNIRVPSKEDPGYLEYSSESNPEQVAKY